MKNVVITGSTRGIGLAMAKEFLRFGCNLTISGRGKECSVELTNQLSEFMDKYIYVSCNVSCYGDIDKLWNDSLSKWGRIDIWINNAGINSPYEFLWNIDSKDVDSIIGTNITGLIYGSGVAAKNMTQQKYGQIWNMEGLGSNDMIQPKTAIYGTSKRALTYFSKALSRELKDTGILVGRLSPGMMLTDLITKTAKGEDSPVIKDEKFKSVFNILADRPETVAAFFVPKILKNTRNDAHLVWLTNLKASWRFLTAGSRKRKLI
jgi:short-subunit dehydrogenase